MDEMAVKFMMGKFERMSNEELVEYASARRQCARAYENGLNGQMEGANLDQMVTIEMRAGGLAYRYAHFHRPEIAARIAETLR